MEKRHGNAPSRSDGRPFSELPVSPKGHVRTPPAPVTTPSEGRRERHRREAFERMVRVAHEILFSKEIDDIRVADITEAADVGKGTFFNHFESKEDIVTGFAASDPMSAIERIRNSGQTAFEALKESWCGFRKLWPLDSGNSGRLI